MIQINTTDLHLITQPIVNTRIKIDVYNERTMTHLEQWECGIINATFSVSAESDIRRTASISAVPVRNEFIRLHRDGIIWINRIVKIAIGIEDMRTNEYTYYPMGVFVFNNYSANYSATSNELSLSLSDSWLNLDGSRRGQVGGAPTISFPAYIENEQGEVIHYNKIRDIIITILTQMANITDYNIGEIGEFKGLQETNVNYALYREESKVQTLSGLEETWDVLPFDQDFSAGDTIATMLTTLRDLYPNYEMYFDVNGTFCCNLIPSCYDDDIVFDSNFFDRIYISEDTSVDLTTVKNVCEVWGQTIDADFYTENCTYANNIYSCNVDAYDNYYHGDLVAVQIPSVNQASCSININNLGVIPVIDENTEEPMEANLMEANQVYVFKIKSKYINGTTTIQAYLQGQWQAHGLCVLTNGNISNEDYTTQNGNVVKKFSKEYFQDKYNCKSVTFTEITDNPFCVQELGEILDVKTGGEYENIGSDSYALARASYELYKDARLTDSISITTKLCPFADVNIKVSYRRKDNNEINQYIVKNLSHDPSNGTTNWTFIRFYPLYSNEELAGDSTWEVASEYEWDVLDRNNAWDNTPHLIRKDFTYN